MIVIHTAGDCRQGLGLLAELGQQGRKTALVSNAWKQSAGGLVRIVLSKMVIEAALISMVCSSTFSWVS